MTYDDKFHTCESFISLVCLTPNVHINLHISSSIYLFFVCVIDQVFSKFVRSYLRTDVKLRSHGKDHLNFRIKELT